MRGESGAPFWAWLQSPYGLLTPSPERNDQTQTQGGAKSDHQKGPIQVDKRNEAQILFPKIRELELAYVGSSSATVRQDNVRNDLAHMRHEHGAVGDLLSRIQDATEDYNATATTCPSYREICQKLKELDGEVRQEVHLENNVLFNRALRISEALYG